VLKKKIERVIMIEDSVVTHKPLGTSTWQDLCYVLPGSTRQQKTGTFLSKLMASFKASALGKQNKTKAV
jgi:hypothetical protein